VSDTGPISAELRRRLALAEAALEALRRGEVDLVVGADAPRLVRAKSLVEENERLASEWQKTFDALDDMACIVDADQRLLRCNLAMERYLGRQASAMVGQPCFHIVHGTAAPHAQCPFLRARRSLQRETAEMQLGDRWFQVTVDPLLDADRRLTGAVQIARDITRQKQAEEQLRQKTERLSGLLDVSLALAGAREPTALFQTIVTSAVRLLPGGSAALLLVHDDTLSLAATVPPLPADFPAEFRVAALAEHPYIGRALDTGAPVILADAREAELTAAERRICELRGLRSLLYVPLLSQERCLGVLIVGSVEASHSFTDEEADLYRVLASHAALEIDKAHLAEENRQHIAALERLTAEQQRTEQALRDSEAHFRRLAENAQDIIYRYEFAPTRGFTYVNPAAVAMTGYTPEEHYADPDLGLKIIHPDDRPLLEAVAGATSDFTRPLVLRWVRKDGSLLWTEQRNVPLYDEQGNLVAMEGIARDITERVKAEEERARLQEQLQRAQRLEAIGRLAGGIAHDFNNVLGVILGYAEMALERLLPEDPLRTDLEQIVAAAQRAASLTRQLLAFSRRQPLRPVAMSLNEAIGGMEKMLRRLLGEDIELALALAPDLPAVQADPAQIEQVLMNLAVNAREAMPAGGKLRIETAAIELDAARAAARPGVAPGPYVQLTVTDTGCGMTAEVAAQIFDPFFTTKERGTGLGLATVYGIVTQSGGSISVSSEPGQDTTFRIYLPVTGAPPPVAATQPAGHRSPGQGKHVLVVEDEEGLRKLITAFLSRLGYRVSAAASGGEALLLVEEKGLRPDLLLTDVVMPNISGRELVDRLRRSQPDLKVLLMSGYTDTAILHHGQLEASTPFIEKPFSIDRLATKIREVIGGHGR